MCSKTLTPCSLRTTLLSFRPGSTTCAAPLRGQMKVLAAGILQDERFKLEKGRLLGWGHPAFVPRRSF
jgi:hypothetical protein